MNVLRSAAQYAAIAAFALTFAISLPLRAQEHSRAQTPQHREMTADQQAQAGALVNAVRQATARFQDVTVAEADGYALSFGCVSGDDSGAMGLHYVNNTLLNLNVVDPVHPPIVIYEPTPGGAPKLIGADYLVFADAWDAKHPGEPPQLGGQLFHFFETPNRFGLPAFYTLHVWAWKDNPNGAFVNWHPDVSCQSFVGETTK